MEPFLWDPGLGADHIMMLGSQESKPKKEPQASSSSVRVFEITA